MALILPSVSPKQLTFTIVAFNKTGSTGASSVWVTSLSQTGFVVSRSLTSNVYVPGSVKFVNTPVVCVTILPNGVVISNSRFVEPPLTFTVISPPGVVVQSIDLSTVAETSICS